LIVIPAVDILDGKAVQLVGGTPGTEKVSLHDPAKVALEWEGRGAPGMHIVDLDAALGRGDNLRVIKEILATLSIPAQVGGGIRSSEKVGEILDAGAERVVVGTRGLTDHEWLSSIAQENPRRIVLAVDVRGGKVQIRGWQQSAGITIASILERIKDTPIAAVLHTNVDVEGRNEGIDAEEMREFIRLCPRPVIASGGIKNIEDIVVLRNLGAWAAVVGMALYTGGIDPSEIWRKE